MTRGARIGVVIGLAVAGALAAALLPPQPQSQAYHRMADGRPLLGIPNALNVLSNLPFLAVGLYGLARLGPGPSAGAFLDARERFPYAVFFVGLALTGLGSAYYHLEPGDARLVWDRLPLGITIMGLFSAVITERIGVKAGLGWLGPLILLAIASVLHWQAGMARGQGDLRFYGLVQFYPMLAVPLVMALFPPRYTRGGDLVVALGLYVVAKVFEALDAAVLAAGHVVSGHTIKHLLAGLSGYAVARMLTARAPAIADNPSMRGAA
ncbi:MAG TPA: hypothetical protein VML54_04355 [Candidatus Limnocylindrales bacterium]|nr:hypothetical protein [Candidatus Limnocylindrales bacterium]